MTQLEASGMVFWESRKASPHSLFISAQWATFGHLNPGQKFATRSIWAPIGYLTITNGTQLPSLRIIKRSWTPTCTAGTVSLRSLLRKKSRMFHSSAQSLWHHSASSSRDWTKPVDTLLWSKSKRDLSCAKRLIYTIHFISIQKEAPPMESISSTLRKEHSSDWDLFFQEFISIIVGSSHQALVFSMDSRTIWLALQIHSHGLSAWSFLYSNQMNISSSITKEKEKRSGRPSLDVSDKSWAKLVTFLFWTLILKTSLSIRLFFSQKWRTKRCDWESWVSFK